MTVGAAICEFNPLHNGHKYFLSQAKNSGTDALVCVMSGNFVQRGEIALCDKYRRAESAVKNGADLVLELPAPYSLGTAETFARGAVGLISSLSCVDKLFFGAENSLDDIMYAISECETQAAQDEIKRLLNQGLSYPDAVGTAIKNPVLSGSNNVLAMEYIRQLKALNRGITPVAIDRVGAYHDEKDEKDGFLSASAVREKVRKNEDCSAYLPRPVRPCEVARQDKLEVAMLSKFRTMSGADFADIADVTEGLEYRIRKAVDSSKSVAEIAEKVKTKRYTNAKIRRILMCAYLGVTKEMQSHLPRYVRILATNETGLKIIKTIKERSDISVICNHSDAQNLDEKDKALYDFCNTCDDLFGLCLDKIEICGYNQKRKFEVIEDIDGNE